MTTAALLAADGDAKGPSEAPNIIERVYEFNRIGQVVPPGPNFNADRVGFYTGMQLEEMAEKLTAIACGEVDVRSKEWMLDHAHTLDRLGKDFKAGKFYGSVLRADREALLDADIDIAVVTVGALTYQTPKFRGAVAHVLDKNDAKFSLVDGVLTATRDDNGKILKPLGWTPPDLAPFIDPPND